MKIRAGNGNAVTYVSEFRSYRITCLMFPRSAVNSAVCGRSRPSNHGAYSKVMSDSQYIDQKAAARSYRPGGYVRCLKVSFTSRNHNSYVPDVPRVKASARTLQGEEYGYRACN